MKGKPNSYASGIRLSTIRRPAGYPDTMYDPNVPSNNPNYGKIVTRQSPRLLRGMVRVSF